MEGYLRSDLACENSENLSNCVDGAETSIYQNGGYRILRMRIKNQSAAKTIGKPIGTYITVECGKIHYLGREKATRLSRILSGELRGMAEVLTGKSLNPEFGVLVIGLGNAELTADSLGPQTVSKLTATRHLREHEGALYREIGCCALSSLAPGVLGQTGIEAAELLCSAVETVKPDLVLAVDALAARSCDRLASTVQISDVGIVPGSGVGNHRSAINSETLGIPVIALGIPTVVDSSTLVYDALREAHVEQIDDALKAVLENGRSFFVSPKESDVIAEHISSLLSQSIEYAFVGDLSF